MTKHYKLIIPISICFWLIFFSCGENKEVSTYTATKRDFRDIVMVEGLVEPVKSVNIVSPRRGGQGVVAYLIEEGTWVEQGDTVCIIENQNLENQYDQQLTNLEKRKAELEKTRADLSMQYALLDAQVKTNEATTQIANLDSLQLAFYSPNQKKIRELELKQVEIERAKYGKKLEALSIIQNSELRKRELEILRIQNRVESTKAELEALVLKAPRGGLVIRGINWSTGLKFELGDNIWGNMIVVSIPEMDQMKVKIEASETDYRYININDSVVFRFDALPESVAYGRIINKMPIGKEISRGSKVKFFEIEASIDSTLVMPDPGFTAQCHIYLKQVRDTIVIPQIAIYEQDSMKVVYVKNKKGFEIRQIETGETSAKEAVVVRGVNNGDIMALRKPSDSSISGRVVFSDTINNER